MNLYTNNFIEKCSVKLKSFKCGNLMLNSICSPDENKKKIIYHLSLKSKILQNLKELTQQIWEAHGGPWTPTTGKIGILYYARKFNLLLQVHQTCSQSCTFLNINHHKEIKFLVKIFTTSKKKLNKKLLNLAKLHFEYIIEVNSSNTSAQDELNKL